MYQIQKIRTSRSQINHRKLKISISRGMVILIPEPVSNSAAIIKVQISQAIYTEFESIIASACTANAS